MFLLLCQTNSNYSLAMLVLFKFLRPRKTISLHLGAVYAQNFRLILKSEDKWGLNKRITRCRKSFLNIFDLTSFLVKNFSLKLKSFSNLCKYVYADTDECKTQDVCSGGTCVNNDGGFLCECPSDTRISADGTYCISK